MFIGRNFLTNFYENTTDFSVKKETFELRSVAACNCQKFFFY